MSHIRKYIAEFIGTFFLILTIFCTVVGSKPGDGVIPPLAIGAALMVMVYACGHISGAHFNPAVTLAVTLRGKASWADMPGYLVAQVLAGLLASFITIQFIEGQGPPMADAYENLLPPILAEALFTFALAFVVLNVATAKGTAGNSFYGLAIGMTVMAGAFAVGNHSGGAFNPAVAISLAAHGLIPVKQIWIHLSAEFGAGLLAALVFLFINPSEESAA